MNGSLLPAHRRTLRLLADVIVPRTATMPSAGDLGLADTPVDQVLAARPDLVGPLALLLDKLAGEAPGLAVPRLAAADPAGFHILMQAIAGAYYMHGTVWRLLDYAGQEASPPPDDGGLAVAALAVRMAASPKRFRRIPDEEPRTPAQSAPIPSSASDR